ncbi:hypothetical protein ACTWPT_17815 [Nonomuraea sp. 3N208]|uniref:hypothetical protein n=1 Tax=Nonomuraea sp. 3N208 TaxID=3457421 RepID=UPI003FCD3191
MLHKAFWRRYEPRDSTAWTIQKIGAVSTLYTSPWFINPSTKDKNGRWILDTKAMKRHRSVMLNSTVDIKSQPCFVVKSASAEYGFSIGGGFSKDGAEYSGSNSIAVTQAGGKDCGSELLAPGSVRKTYGPLYSNVGLRTAMWSSPNAADADCWQTSGSVCGITRYTQKTEGIFHYARKEGDSSNKITGPPRPGVTTRASRRRELTPS